MKKLIYIAMLKDGVILTDEIELYFREQEITVLNYYSNLGLIELEASEFLNINNLKYIEALELERSFTTEN